MYSRWILKTSVLLLAFVSFTQAIVDLMSSADLNFDALLHVAMLPVGLFISLPTSYAHTGEHPQCVRQPPHA